MRLLMCSYDFYPRIGGTETAGRMLASGLVRRGYDVTVVTVSPTTAADETVFPFKLVRRPDPATLLRLYRNAVWHNQISLRLLWPWLLCPRPLVFVHHSALQTSVGPLVWRLKRLACMLGANVFVSKAHRDAVRLDGPVLLNSYDEDAFKLLPDIARDRDIAYLGRLVPEKGGDILIDALARIDGRGRRASATIIGSGPDEASLTARVAAAGLADRVEFTGVLRGAAIARALNRHRILVIPSRVEETFGIVALEALACGCVVVGANSGGLPEAIGPCGPVVAKNDSAAFADAIEKLLADPDLLDSYRRRIPGHLAAFGQAALIDACEAVIGDAVAGRARGGWKTEGLSHPVR